MDFYLPFYSQTSETELDQAILTQVLLPQISDPKSDLYKFFRSEDVLKLEEKRRKTITNKVIPLNPKYGLDTRYYTRNKVEHIKFMQELSTVQAAVLQPFARFYLVLGDKKVSSLDPTKNAIPVSFNSVFDTNYYQASQRTTARGEGAGIESINVIKTFNKTGAYDPVTVSAKFYFSSYDVLINKPAVETGRSIYAVDALLNSLNGSVVPTYKDILYRRAKDDKQKVYSVLLEYGWTVSPGVSESILSAEQREIIEKRERKFIALTPKKHTISFNEDGSLTMEVDYRPKILDRIVINGFDGVFNLTLDKDNPIEKEISEQRKILERLKAQKDLSERAKEARNRSIAATENNIQKLIKRRKGLLAKKIIKQIEKEKLFNYYNVKIDKSNPNGNTIFSDFYIGDPDKPDAQKTFRKFYSFKKIEESLKKAVVESKLSSSFAKKSAADGTISEKSIRDAQDSLYKNLVAATFKKYHTFIFFKDLVRIIYKITKNSDEFLESPDRDLPNIILDNIAFPMPNGERFWVNTGDIPITKEKLMNSLTMFFIKKEKGNLRDFLNYFKDEIIPEKLVTKQQALEFPALSYPLIRFNFPQYIKDLNATFFDFTPEKLYAGDKKEFEKFFENYFDENDIQSADGCFVFGQSPRSSFENTSIDNSSKIKLLKESFFKNDIDILEAGIAKLIIGKSSGILKTLNFTSNQNPSITEFNNIRAGQKPGVPTVAISSNFQYSIDATLFGNQIINLLSGYVYVPSYSFGQTNSVDPGLVSALSSGDANIRNEADRRIRESININDFEVGGLYRVYTVTDTIDFTSNVYETKINGNIYQRDSQLILSTLESFKNEAENKRVIFPEVGVNVSLTKYLLNYFDKIFVTRKKIK